MTDRDDRENIDAAFRELISREWPHERPKSTSDEATSNTTDTPPPVAPTSEPSLFDWIDPNPEPEAEPEYTLDHVEPDDPGDDWRPPSAPLPQHFRGISPLGVLGGVLLLASLLAVVCVILFPSTRSIASVIAIGGFASGLLILLSRLPRHRPPSGGNGAIV